MTFVARRISIGLIEPIQGVDECRAPGLGSRVKSRSLGIRFVEEHMVISDNSDFDDFEDLEEGPNLGLKEEHGLCSTTCILDMIEIE